MFQRMAVSTSWLLLIHQLPPRPLYLRAQVRRRLAQVGAMPLKNSVYVLPGTAGCLEDLQWIAQEAIAGGGEAVVCRAEFVGTPTDNELRTRFLDDATGRFTPVKEALAEHLRFSAGESTPRRRVQKSFVSSEWSMLLRRRTFSGPKRAWRSRRS
jgi:hypothetical protein